MTNNFFLAIGQQDMLTTNLWVQAGLVYGSLGKVIDIVYKSNEQPPSLPSFVVVEFLYYKGPLWDALNPTYVPISPTTREYRTQLPLPMAWGLTIHKAQGMTLQNVTIDIGNTDRQGLTFTTISRVTSLSGLRISPLFSFSRCSRMHVTLDIGEREKWRNAFQAFAFLHFSLSGLRISIRF